MYKRLRKEYNAFSPGGYRYLYLPTAVVTSSHSCDEILHGREEMLPRPWRVKNSVALTEQYRLGKSSITAL